MMTRCLSFVCCSMLLATPAFAQSTGAGAADTSTVVALRRSFAEVSGFITKSADMVPADKYSYRPTPSVMTFAQVIAHVADSYYFYCARVAGRPAPDDDATARGPLDKATLVAKLKQATDVCTAAYAGKPVVRPALTNIGHTNLHYGNIITYLRMLGMTPPSS
jgi:uncharacterized damage-inducible protein DinB